MRFLAALFIFGLFVGSSFAGLLQSAIGAIECPQVLKKKAQTPYLTFNVLQNFLVKDKINDKAFMKKQIKCFLEDVGCDEFGKKVNKF